MGTFSDSFFTRAPRLFEFTSAFFLSFCFETRSKKPADPREDDTRDPRRPSGQLDRENVIVESMREKWKSGDWLSSTQALAMG